MNDLTSDEIALIQQLRAEQATRDAAQDFQRKAIATAHAFNNWSDASGYGLTFSTFVNNFGYQDKDGRQMYEAVKRILDAAWPEWLCIPKQISRRILIGKGLGCGW